MFLWCCLLQVVKVLSDTEVLGRVLNSKSLGERKNCNLPGVQVQLPVLTDKDVKDVQEFAARNKMDYISASFVQSADDVR
jgi:pyruvate kinase